MPIFEYRCDACGSGFEELTPVGGTDGVTCRSCGSGAVSRLLSSFAVGRTASAGRATVAVEPGPCGACGAPQRGMCGEG